MGKLIEIMIIIICLSLFPVAAAIAHYNENRPHPDFAIQIRKSKLILQCIGIAIIGVITLIIFSFIMQGSAILGFWNWRLMP